MDRRNVGALTLVSRFRAACERGRFRAMTVLLLRALAILTMLGGLPASAQQPANPPAQGGDVREQFVGHWKLVKFENFDESGAARDAGYDSGRIMYDAAGNMSAQLMRTGRQRMSQPSTEAERAAAYSTYTAYYGRYTVDPQMSRVTHSVEGAVNPNWVKTDLVRYYEFSADGQQLKLSLRNAQNRTTGTLTWQRLH
jgi:hypothetical protein